MISLNNKRTRDTLCGCHQHQSGKRQGTRKKERLYIGESPKPCDSRLCRQQAVLRGPENQTLHLVSKTELKQLQRAHIQASQWESKANNNIQEWDKKEVNTHSASFYCLQTGSVCPVKSDSLLLDGRPPHRRRVTLNQPKSSQSGSSDFASASETCYIFLYHELYVQMFNKQSMFMFGINSFK